jgi:glycosyltransferase involved in cell wall biosynthesis
MGIPVVVTPVAVAGMELHDGDGLLVADSAALLADAVLRLLSDASLRADLGKRGRELALQRLSLEATYDPLVRFLEERCEAADVKRGVEAART